LGPRGGGGSKNPLRNPRKREKKKKKSNGGGGGGGGENTQPSKKKKLKKKRILPRKKLDHSFPGEKGCTFENGRLGEKKEGRMEYAAILKNNLPKIGGTMVGQNL